MGSCGHKLKHISFDCRLTILDTVKNAGAGHIGGSMSCIDILTALYFSIMNENDKFILSKGHCAEALYAVLYRKGIISSDLLKTFAKFDTALAGHPTPKVPGVEFATGALGHGLSVGVGMGIGLNFDKSPACVYVLLGDGELAEGSNWEAAMAASKYRLNNLTAIIDRNRLQISGNTEDVMPLDDLAAKFTAFGWEARFCGGHRPADIASAVKREHDKPLAVIADTIKGYGSNIMEGRAEWHHHIPNEAEYREIKAELLRRRDEHD